IVFVIYYVRAIRFTVDYNFIIIFFIAISINYIIVNMSGYNNGLSGKLFKGNAAKIVAGLFLLYIVTQIPSNNIYDYLKYYRPAGWGIDNDFIHVELFKFLK